MKKILFIILNVLMLASCTLYMDNNDDGKGADGDVADGDGFSAPHTDVTADGTTTYQFNPTTRVFDENNSRYVVNVSDSVVWLSASIPYDQLPQVGDAIYSRFSETFPDGMMAKVMSVTKENGMLKCVCTKTSLAHIFKELDVKLSIPVANYIDSIDGESSQAQHRNNVVGNTRSAEKNADPVLSVSGSFDTNDFSREDPTDKKWYSFDKGVTGKFSYEANEYLTLDFNMNLSDRTLKIVAIDSLIVKKEISLAGRGEITLRLLGPTDNFKRKLKLKSIPLGTLPIKVGIQPSVTASVKGAMEGGVSFNNTVVRKIGINKSESDGKVQTIFDCKKYNKASMGGMMNVSASAGIKLGLSIDVADKAELLHAGITPYIEPGVKLESGCKSTPEGTCLTTPGAIQVGAEVGLDLYAKINFADNDIWRWDHNIANHYLPWGTLHIEPQLVSMEVVPNDMTSSENMQYLAKVSITDMGKETYRTPMIAVYDENGNHLQDVSLKQKKLHDGIYDLVGEIELPKTENVGYWAEMYYLSQKGQKYYYDDRIPFGIKVDMDLLDLRQASAIMDLNNTKRPWTFEVRGTLKKTGSVKVSKWGLRFDMFNEKGQKVGKAQNAYFRTRDGKETWGVIINSKKPGPYKLKVTPFFHTGYGIKDEKTTVLDDKACNVTISPDFGECTEPEWAKPGTYIELSGN